MRFRELLEIAVDELHDLTQVEKPDFRLEQAKYNDKKKTWEIVVSYLVENTNQKINLGGLSSGLSGFKYYRIYQKLIIGEDKKVHEILIFDDKG